MATATTATTAPFFLVVSTTARKVPDPRQRAFRWGAVLEGRPHGCTRRSEAAGEVGQQGGRAVHGQDLLQLQSRRNSRTAGETAEGVKQP